MPAGMRLPRLETKIKYEKSHCFDLLPGDREEWIGHLV